jgi:hypothetical protein
VVAVSKTEPKDASHMVGADGAARLGVKSRCKVRRLFVFLLEGYIYIVVLVGSSKTCIVHNEAYKAPCSTRGCKLPTTGRFFFALVGVCIANGD